MCSHGVVGEDTSSLSNPAKVIATFAPGTGYDTALASADLCLENNSLLYGMSVISAWTAERPEASDLSENRDIGLSRYAGFESLGEKGNRNVTMCCKCGRLMTFSEDMGGKIYGIVGGEEDIDMPIHVLCISLR